MKMKTELLLRKLLVVDIGKSNPLYTDLSLPDISNVFIKYGQDNYAYDEKRGQVILRNNFAVQMNSEELDLNKSVNFTFFRYYHRFYAVYIVLALIISTVAAFVYDFPPGFSRKLSTNVIVCMVPLALFLLIYKLITIIKGIEEIDYSKKADEFYQEISDVIKDEEKEKSLCNSQSSPAVSN